LARTHAKRPPGASCSAWRCPISKAWQGRAGRHRGYGLVLSSSRQRAAQDNGQDREWGLATQRAKTKI